MEFEAIILNVVFQGVGRSDMTIFSNIEFKEECLKLWMHIKYPR